MKKAAKKPAKAATKVATSKVKSNGSANSNAAPCPIFRDMTLDERAQVLGMLETQRFEKGKVILREGEKNQSLWILVHGRCEVIKSAKKGAEQQLAALEPGAVFGEMSFFESAPHSASIRALTEVEVMRLSRENYERLRAEQSPSACKIAASVISVIAQRLRRMDEWTCGLLESPDGANHREEWQEFRAKLYSGWQF